MKRLELTLKSIDSCAVWIENNRIYIDTVNLDQFEGLRYSYTKTFFNPFYTVACSVSEFIMFYDRKLCHAKELLNAGLR